VTPKKHRFSYIERVSVWQAYDGQCFWCGEPLPLKHLTVDHVIPESLLSDPEVLERIKHEYRLPARWEINSYANWVPAHPDCNGRKAANLLPSSPAFLLLLDGVVKRAPRSKALDQHWRKQRRGDRVLAHLMVALEDNTLTPADVLAVLEQWPRVEPLRDSVPAFTFEAGVSVQPSTPARLRELVASAFSKVDVSAPFLGSGFLEECLATGTRGVRVRLLISDYQIGTGAPVDVLPSHRIADSRIEIRVLRHLHEKQIVVDRRIAAFPSGGFTGPTSNWESVIYISDDRRISGITEAFEHFWASAVPLDVFKEAGAPFGA
jgi:hypothetical protein